MYRASGVLLLLTFVLAKPLLGAGSNNATTGRATSLVFDSADRKIRADLYSPAGPKSMRTIIVLHGAGGMLFDGPRMRRVARALAEEGDTVYLLHYFNRTGTIAARDREMQARFDDWLQTVRDGIAWAHGREGNGARPIGIYGYSLGAFLAIAASSNDPRVGAVTEQAGGMWNSQEGRVGKMPPVLIVHGVTDKRVPFDKYAKPLLRVLRARGGEVETDFVPREGHVFSETAMKAVRSKAAEFFAHKLPSIKASEYAAIR
ncbi:MAG: hypothetical protein DLM52_09995 [Chthoniobacterales bacterium]|nr:MAG: hypothetical protein DLM52_09995 [Chthoniobacterales bacterium]